MNLSSHSVCILLFGQSEETLRDFCEAFTEFYSADPMPEEIVETIIAVSRTAPTSCIKYTFADNNIQFRLTSLTGDESDVVELEELLITFEFVGIMENIGVAAKEMAQAANEEQAVCSEPEPEIKCTVNTEQAVPTPTAVSISEAAKEYQAVWSMLRSLGIRQGIRVRTGATRLEIITQILDTLEQRAGKNFRSV
jgi:hypothetical protein